MLKAIGIVAVAGSLSGIAALVWFYATHHCAGWADSVCQSCYCTMYNPDMTMCLAQACDDHPCSTCVRYERDR